MTATTSSTTEDFLVELLMFAGGAVRGERCAAGGDSCA
jgi:hypothetical protein